MKFLHSHKKYAAPCSNSLQLTLLCRGLSGPCKTLMGSLLAACPCATSVSQPNTQRKKNQLRVLSVTTVSQIPSSRLKTIFAKRFLTLILFCPNCLRNNIFGGWRLLKCQCVSRIQNIPTEKNYLIYFVFLVHLCGRLGLGEFGVQLAHVSGWALPQGSLSTAPPVATGYGSLQQLRP